MKGSRLGLLWQVLRAEGVAAFRDRLLDRLAARQRRRRFRVIAVESPAGVLRGNGESLPSAPLLNILSTPPRRDLGGVQVQLLRRLEAEAAHRPWALLYPEGGHYRLEIVAGKRRLAIELQAPPPPADCLLDSTFEWAVQRAAHLLQTDVLHFEQAIGWPLESIARLHGTGFQLMLSVHDFGLFCLRPHLLERPHLRFCEYSRDDQRCGQCLRCDWEVEDDFQPRRRAQATELLRIARAVVYPSDFLRRTYRQLIPELDSANQHVVEPPAVGRAADSIAHRPSTRVRHVAYVGSVKAHKGALLFEDLVRRFPPTQFPELRWSVYGGGDAEILGRLRKLPAVRVRGYYRADRLPSLLAADDVDLALLLSVWPEAYALTLDECQLAGATVMAFDHGAMADRLRRWQAGELVDPEQGIRGLEERLNSLLKRPTEQVARPSNIPDGESSAKAMREIYRQLNPASQK